MHESSHRGSLVVGKERWIESRRHAYRLSSNKQQAWSIGSRLRVCFAIGAVSTLTCTNYPFSCGQDELPPCAYHTYKTLGESQRILQQYIHRVSRLYSTQGYLLYGVFATEYLGEEEGVCALERYSSSGGEMEQLFFPDECARLNLAYARISMTLDMQFHICGGTCPMRWNLSANERL